MEELFLHVLNRSLTGSWLLLAVLLLQPLVKKAPDWLRGTLWTLTALRLVCPFVLPVPIGFAPSAEPVPQGMLYAASPAVDTGIAALDDAVNPLLSAQLSPEAGDSVNPMQVLVFAGSVICAEKCAHPFRWGRASAFVTGFHRPFCSGFSVPASICPPIFLRRRHNM